MRVLVLVFCFWPVEQGPAALVTPINSFFLFFCCSSFAACVCCSSCPRLTFAASTSVGPPLREAPPPQQGSQSLNQARRAGQKGYRAARWVVGCPAPCCSRRALRPLLLSLSSLTACTNERRWRAALESGADTQPPPMHPARRRAAQAHTRTPHILEGSHHGHERRDSVDAPGAAQDRTRRVVLRTR